MKKDLNLIEWIENFKNGNYNDPDVSVQIKAGWYDWFCKEKSLAAKTKSLGKNLFRL